MSKVVDFRKDVSKKLAELKAQKTEYTTTGIYTGSGVVAVNIKTAGKTQLVNLCATLINRKDACEFLGIDTKVSGFTPKEWMEDCKTRMKQLERNVMIQKLEEADADTVDLLEKDELKDLKISGLTEKLDGIL